ncbi:MAG: hypothetical protein HXK63_01540 [Campylobacter sp.]|nr:hypothetical protein [Campylobacter sp.]
MRICERDEKASRATRKYGALLAGVENIGLAPICGSTVEILNRICFEGDNSCITTCIGESFKQYRNTAFLRCV